MIGQLDERFEIQARKNVYNAPFLMGQGVWIDSEKLGPTDELREVLKHGTLTMGFIGLAEMLDGADRASTTASQPRPSAWVWRSSATCAPTCDARVAGASA